MHHLQVTGLVPVDKRSIVSARPWHKCHRSPLALHLTSFKNSACSCSRYRDRVMEGRGWWWDSQESASNSFFENVSFGAKRHEVRERKCKYYFPSCATEK